MDIDEIIPHVVVDRTIRHDDGPFHWYCNGSDCSPHNFYWYAEPDAQKLHLIPWDLDNAFESITNTNPVTTIRDDWGEISNNCQPFSGSFFGIQQLSAACDPIVKGWTLYDDEFEATKQALIEGPMSQASIDTQLDKWAQQIHDATQEAHELHSDAINLSTWNNEMQKLKNQMSVARSN